MRMHDVTEAASATVCTNVLLALYSEALHSASHSRVICAIGASVLATALYEVQCEVITYALVSVEAQRQGLALPTALLYAAHKALQALLMRTVGIKTSLTLHTAHALVSGTVVGRSTSAI
jgi:hypothetical protein